MPKFDVDVQGVTYEVDAPDERTAWKWANQTHARASQPARKLPSAPPDDSMLKRAIGGAVEPLVSLGTGAVAAPVAGLSGIAATIGNAAGLTDKNPGDVVRSVQSAMTYDPKTEGGKAAMGVIGAPLEAISNAADYAGGKVTDLTRDPMLGTAVNTGIQALPMLLGMKGAPKAAPVVANASEGAANWLLARALKAPLEDLKNGNANRAYKTMLDEGVNVSEGGVRKLQDRITSINDEVTNAILNSPAQVDKRAVTSGLPVQELIDRTKRQVAPQSDLAEIAAAVDKMDTHPLVPGNLMPVQLAQELKKGTYKQLADKYDKGEAQNTASVNAQKAMARSLKDEIAGLVPEVEPLNARESALINAKNLVERRAKVAGRNNPLGLTPMTSNPLNAIAFMADRSPLFLSALARSIYGAGRVGEAPLMAGNNEAERRQRIIDAIISQGGTQ